MMVPGCPATRFHSFLISSIEHLQHRPVAPAWASPSSRVSWKLKVGASKQQTVLKGARLFVSVCQLQNLRWFAAKQCFRRYSASRAFTAATATHYQVTRVFGCASV